MLRYAYYIFPMLLRAAAASSAAAQEIRTFGPVTHLKVPAHAGQAGGSIDYANARAMPLPNPGVAPPSLSGSLSSSPGARRR